MRTIYKYPIKITGVQEIRLPLGRVLHVGLDPTGQPCIWAEVDTDCSPIVMPVYIVGTGNPMPEHPTDHIGSFVMGPFVWHVYVYHCNDRLMSGR